MSHAPHWRQRATEEEARRRHPEAYDFRIFVVQRIAQLRIELDALEAALADFSPPPQEAGTP